MAKFQLTEIGRNGHHGQSVRDPVVPDIWSAIEVALTHHHNMADWTVQLTTTDTVFCTISLATNTTVQVWFTVTLANFNITQVFYVHFTIKNTRKIKYTTMWANAQRDGRPTEHRWRPLFNAAKIGWRSLLDCRAITLPRRESC